MFYSHVNYSVTKINKKPIFILSKFYSHVNYSVTKIRGNVYVISRGFYSHVNYSVTKMFVFLISESLGFTVT